MKGRNYRSRCDSMKSMRYLSFFNPIFFCYISITGGRIGEREESTVPTRCPEQYATILVFR